MNNYAKGGQAHGLATLEGHKIHTKDGVPSFGFGGFFQRNVMKPVTNAVVGGVKAVQNIPGIKQVSDVSTQAFKPIDQALVGLDKSVGKMIPGGWGTIAQTALSMNPVTAPLGIAMGAANGSGVLRKGGSFNLQGAMIGGATAYATSELGDYLRGADTASGTAGSSAAMLPESSSVIAGELGDIAVNSQGQLLNASGQVLNPATQAATQAAISAAPTTLANSAPYVSPSALQDQYVSQGLQEGYTSAFREPSLLDKAFTADTYTKPFTDAGTYISNIPSNIGKGLASTYDSSKGFLDSATNLDTYKQAYDTSMSDLSKTGAGIKNLITGPAGTSSAAKLASGVSNPAAMAGLAGYGVMNMADMDAQRSFLKDQLAAGNMAQAEYDQALAEINRQAEFASQTVAASPFSTNPNRDVSIGETFYDRGAENDNLFSRAVENSRLYAVGGPIDDSYGMDEARGLDTGNMQNGLFGGGGIGSLNLAAGGMTPRFLSGGGDGMSDDIPATIGKDQPARLADGEFVIPADVVSHLGNGSSKAGAKQLYSMMNRIRKARTGNSKQGKQINPRKYLAA